MSSPWFTAPRSWPFTTVISLAGCGWLGTGAGRLGTGGGARIVAVGQSECRVVLDSSVVVMVIVWEE